MDKCMGTLVWVESIEQDPLAAALLTRLMPHTKAGELGWDCDLAGGHPGEHLSYFHSPEAESGEDEWLLWTESGQHRLVLMQPCDSTQPGRDPEDEEGAVCCLPRGHHGVHGGGEAKWERDHYEVYGLG